MNVATSVLELSKDCWCVEIDGRMYRAEYVDNDDVSPLDRWRVRNVNRLRYLPWDSPTLTAVVNEVRRHVLLKPLS